MASKKIRSTMRNMNEQMKNGDTNSAPTFSTSSKPPSNNVDKGDYIDFEEIK